MSREMQSSGINYYMMPDAQRESYARHVQMRAEAFCLLVYTVASLCVRLRPPKSYEKYLSDKADVQVSVGVYLPGAKIDAAHLCNTSFLSEQFLSDLASQSTPVSDDLRKYCAALRTHSGATTPQFKHDNVGPDKVIDSFQTEFKNRYLREVFKTGAVPEPRTTWNDYVTGLNLHFSKSKSGSFQKPGSSGRPGAEMAKYVMEEIENEGGSGRMDWAQEDEMKYAQQKINGSF